LKEGKKMKKFLCLILAIIMVLPLAACGAPSTPADTTPSGTTPSDTPDASTPTGDSFVLFASIALLSVIGVAFVAKRREN
jgi:ABC-type glycerol-3-phosphate transport system substrate-binding protein